MNERFATWAGVMSPAVLQELLGYPTTEQPMTIWPIVDRETCGSIDGYPRHDQWCAVAFTSKMQDIVAHALEQYYHTDKNKDDTQSIKHELKTAKSHLVKCHDVIKGLLDVGMTDELRASLIQLHVELRDINLQHYKMLDDINQ